MSLSLDSFQVSMLIWLLVGLAIGLLLARLFGAGTRRRLTVAETQLGEARTHLEARDTRIHELEHDLAAARDQVRPLADEVDRLRREQARFPSAQPSEPDAPVSHMAPGEMPDDLKLLKGVGDRFAAKLHAIGVHSYRQIADWTPDDVRLADEKLDNFRGRIERDRLVEQAQLLADGRTTEYEARFGRIGAGE